MNYEKVVLEGLKFFGGAASTKQLGQYMCDNILDWSLTLIINALTQQELKLKNLVVSASQFKESGD